MPPDATRLIARLERDRRGLVRWMQARDLGSSRPPPSASLERWGASTPSRSQVAIELSRIDAALRRWFEGRFGQCCRCGLAMEPERLEVDPATPLCGPCQGISTDDHTGQR
jgi:hypothetical protein